MEVNGADNRADGLNGINGTRARNPLVHDFPEPLHVVVVGAGIGGLSAAIGLRRNGHRVDLFEQSKTASEFGAAVHISPNANGLLRRWGISPEELGAVHMDGVVDLDGKGNILSQGDLREPNKMWQHPWQLVHRVTLHDKLKETATSPELPGIPAVLHRSSKVVDVDCGANEVTLEDGTKVTADVIVGADGIYSKTRKFVYGQDAKLFSSGKAAFRFLLPKEKAMEDPETQSLFEKSNTLFIWYNWDRRIVVYPCNGNETLNFVCMHPDSESHATESDEWNKQGTVEQLLKVYEDFDPALKKLLAKVEPNELKVWQLLDMEKLPTWTKDRLALIGDAAHPFTPHQGQGAAQAMEDAVALATVLPKGTYPEDIAERLKLYESIRYERAHAIQEYSRVAGADWVDGKPRVDMRAYTSHNCGHDEADNSENIFKRWLWAKKPDLYWRMPLSFGPFPGPRQDHLGRVQPGPSERTFMTTSIKFKTSRTYLETLFPTSSYRFISPATVCLASISVSTLGNLSWLGGGGYSNWGLFIHGVEYVKKDGSTVAGTLLPVLFEDLTDPIVSGRDELGMNKIYCQIDHRWQPTSFHMEASWRGAKFLDFDLKDLKADDPKTEHGTIGGEDDFGILAYKYIPAVGEPGKADVEYPIVVPHAEEAKVAQADVQYVARSQNASIKFDAGDWTSLPTLCHVSTALARIPIYEVVSAKVVQGLGVPDVSSARRLE